ncbi:hypothetical protein GGR42_000334 [Saonia flava]|uniref:Uncharacterized protein n=1 Tax=Saonia flava TaxID=523696 RepID=A0A846QTN5_9FLAO|nr:hypothetical protein [Saonia flava]NJB69872.1 hypothetical protein [Saonia flava]
MQYLNKEIENLAKKKAAKSLVKKQYSCGIFQDLGKTTMGVEERAQKDAP